MVRIIGDNSDVLAAGVAVMCFGKAILCQFLVLKGWLHANIMLGEFDQLVSRLRGRSVK